MKVAIAGYGLEGEASYRYWQKRGDDVTIVDESHTPDRPIPEGAKVLLGENVFQHLKDYDVVVRTASLPPNAITTKGTIWSATNEFFARCPAPIIGVTGTKGKGTTASLITSILEQAGHTVHLIGNIGVPALDTLEKITKDDLVVYELSSFQLWDLERSPMVAVVLMIEADHLDVHFDFDDYVRAKMNIRKHQTANDICFYHPDNQYSHKIAQSSFDGEIKPFASRDHNTVYARKDGFYVEDYKLAPLDALQLPGKHNIENACAAITAARLFVSDEGAIERGLRSFTGLPHRLKYVRSVDSIEFYDDSIATTPGSTLAAANAFDQPKVMILGGSNKGADFKQFAKDLKEVPEIRGVICIGVSGAEIASAIKKAAIDTTLLVKSDASMKEVVESAHELAKKGDVVLLSPACASFDQYKNYADRGDQFVAAVKEL